MAKVGRYFYCPAAGKIRGNRKSLREWLISKLKRRPAPDLFTICDYYPAYYPSGYKKVISGDGRSEDRDQSRASIGLPVL